MNVLDGETATVSLIDFGPSQFTLFELKAGFCAYEFLKRHPSQRRVFTMVIDSKGFDRRKEDAFET
eukprot:9285233-Heterocapsa_arctica.AAC.1